MNSLCAEFSPPLLSLGLPSISPTDEKRIYHPFPPPSVLAAPEVAARLRSLGFGYRADFIQKTARMLVETHGTAMDTTADSREAGEVWLESLRNRPIEDAREELLKFVGVGRKVADCVLLMSLDKVCRIFCSPKSPIIDEQHRKRWYPLIRTCINWLSSTMGSKARRRESLRCHPSCTTK